MAWRDRPLLRYAVLFFLAPLLAGCRIEVSVRPAESASTSPTTTAPAPSDAVSGSSSELPPLTRADIVGNDMTFDRGGYIEEADTVAFSDGLSRVPGWAQEKSLVSGESVYISDAGCTASLRSTPPQGPLVVAGDDQASTEALFRFLDPSILPEYLVTTNWLWGASPAESTASIEFLTYEQGAAGDDPASIVSLRLFGATGTGLAFTVSCPSDKQLAAAVEEVRSGISVIPPR